MVPLRESARPPHGSQPLTLKRNQPCALWSLAPLVVKGRLLDPELERQRQSTDQLNDELDEVPVPWRLLQQSVVVAGTLVVDRGEGLAGARRLDCLPDLVCDHGV